MERINQLIEAYLQSYCNYEQNYRAEIFAVAEFAHNNSTAWATKITPFYVNYVYEPSTKWPTDIQFRHPASEMYSHYTTGGHKKLSKQIEMVPESIAQYYHTQRRSIEPFKKGELVRLNGKNIQSK